MLKEKHIFFSAWDLSTHPVFDYYNHIPSKHFQPLIFFFFQLIFFFFFAKGSDCFPSWIMLTLSSHASVRQGQEVRRDRISR